MNIKTITCHDVYNHGASLQAFALQDYLKSLGHEVEILNYMPDYIDGYYRLWIINSPRWNKNIVTKLIYLIIKLPSRLLNLRRKKAFDNFRDNFLTLTPDKYVSNEDLKKNCPSAEVFIAGSDQIWNVILPNGRDAAFYLDFAPIESIKISYAASFATETVMSEYKNFVKKMLQNFDHISVREQGALNILKDLGIKDSNWVCDPVFLLDRIRWDEIATKKYKENYVLIYDFDENERIKDIALRLAKKLNLKIFSINLKLKYADKAFKNIGPSDFVSLIRDAEYVISNSFHGTAFALLYNKEFFVVSRKEGINTRMQNLLKFLKLSERLDPTPERALKLNKIEYSVVNEVLTQFAEDSKLFLNQKLK